MDSCFCQFLLAALDEHGGFVDVFEHFINITVLLAESFDDLLYALDVLVVRGLRVVVWHGDDPELMKVCETRRPRM